MSTAEIDFDTVTVAEYQTGDDWHRADPHEEATQTGGGGGAVPATATEPISPSSSLPQWFERRPQPVQVDQATMRGIRRFIVNRLADQVEDEIRRQAVPIATISRNRVVRRFDEDDQIDLAEIVVETQGLDRRQRHEFSEYWMDRLACWDSPLVREHLIVRVR